MSEGDPNHVREWVQSEPETDAKERPLISHVFFPGLKKNSSNCVCVCVCVCVGDGGGSGWHSNPKPVMKEKSMKVKATQSCPTVCDPMNCSLPGPSVHGTL